MQTLQKATLTQLLTVCETTLNAARFKDYCPNGLQVEGQSQISRLALAVTANQAAIEAAVNWGAQALLVHHGLMWKGEDGTVTGFRKTRLKTALQAELSVIAYHLPLDAHPNLGNNVQLGKVLGIARASPLGEDGLLYQGKLGGESAEQTAKTFAQRLQNPVQIITSPQGLQKPLRTIAWCTGGGGAYFEAAIAADVDAYLTGEASEQHVHIARESGVPLLLAGHHATERFGVQALGAHLAESLGIQAQYFEVDSPL